MIEEQPETIADFLLSVSITKFKPKENANIRTITKKEEQTIRSCINQLIDQESKKNCKLLLRGEKKSNIKRKFTKALNSNDSLYDGLFLVGDKAKNYLRKQEDIKHPYKNISIVDEQVVDWIFDKYSSSQEKYFQVPDFFLKSENKELFRKQLLGKERLIDCYLFGLQTIDSDFLVNYVSSTTSPKTAFDKYNDFIIIHWIGAQIQHLTMDRPQLNKHVDELISLGLPGLRDSFHPKESEVASKGCIFPHYILGVYDDTDHSFIANPAIFEASKGWIDEGLDINQSNFKNFIKGS